MKRAYFLSWLVNLHSKNQVSTTQILQPLYPEIETEARKYKEEHYREESDALKEIFKDML